MSFQQYFTEEEVEAVKESCLFKVIQQVRQDFIMRILKSSAGKA